MLLTVMLTWDVAPRRQRSRHCATADVLPGLHDSHMHLISGGVGLSIVSLSAATTVQELQAAIAARAAEKPDEPWLRGRRWDVSLFEDKLHRSQLDAAVADRPA